MLKTIFIFRIWIPSLNTTYYYCFGNIIRSKSIEKNGAKAIKSRLDVEPKKHVSPKLIGLFLSDDGGTIFVTIHMPASIPKGKNKSILYC